MSRKAESKRAGERRDHRRFPDAIPKEAVRMLLDLCWRRIVGRNYQESMTEALLLAALRQAICLRQPPPGLIHHSNRGGQYASREYRNVLRRSAIRQSMRGRELL